MPKIQQIKSHNDTSLQIDNIPRRDFSQFGNQSFSRTAKKSMHESVVPIHEVSYNPQFSKSPLANLEIQKKAHIQPAEPYYEESVYYEFKPRVQQFPVQTEKTNCKTIVFRVLIVLLIVGLIAGLYFVVDAILGHKFSKKSQQKNQNTNSYSSVGVSPIYFNPISYDSMSTYPTQNQGSTTISNNVNSIAPQTFPSVLPSQQYTMTQSQQYKTTQALQRQGSVTNKNFQQSNYDFDQNSIPPLNVYENQPK